MASRRITKTRSDQINLPFAVETPRSDTSKRAIEQGFPSLEISRLARIESYRKNVYRPLYYIHKWWARRTGAVFRAILLGTLAPSSISVLDLFYESNDFADRIILDPFMGGGTTVGEALRLRAKVIGADINPVSWFLVKKIVEPIALSDLDRAYKFVEERVRDRILALYQTTCPKCHRTAQGIYTYWVKLVPCQQCEQPVPLRKSMVLARHMSQPETGLVTCQHCGHPFISEGIHQKLRCPECHQAFDPKLGFSSGARYVCPACQYEGKILDSLSQFSEPPEHGMICLYYHCPTCGKGYKRPDVHDHQFYEAIRERFQRERAQLLSPREPIPSGFNTNQMLKYNYRFWFQMFNERQLLGLSMLLKAIRDIPDQNQREFMLLLFSSALEFNNIFCSAKGLGTGAVRHIFAHHAYIPAKEPFETNLWGVSRSSGGFSILYRERLRRAKEYALSPVERKLTESGAVPIPILGEQVRASLAGSFEELISASDTRVLLLNQSSTQLPQIPDKSVDAIVTDPPYLDNVMYSELSEFFYVWLRLALKDDYPQFQAPTVQRAEEAIKNPEHEKEASFYESILTAVFRECHRVLRDDGLMIFTFHHGSPEAWDALAYSLRSSGFSIERCYPVHAEMDVGVPILGKRGIKFDAILVCTKTVVSCSGGEQLQGSKLLNEIHKHAAPLIAELERAFSVSPEDRFSLFQAIATMFYTQRRTNLLPSQIQHQ